MFERFSTFVRGRGWMLLGLTALGAMLLVGYAVFGDMDVNAIVLSYSRISAQAEAFPLEAFLIATGVYTLLVVFLLPGVPLLSIPLGLILGWGMAIAVTMTATAIGITVLYGLAVWILPERFGRKRGNALDRMAKGLREDAVGYMLFLRLMPPVPFTLLNVGLPALRVPYLSFLLTTLAGMFPRLAAYSFAGEGLRGVIDARIRECAVQMPPCRPDFELADFVTREIVLATGLLALVSLAPIVLRRFSRIKTDV